MVSVSKLTAAEILADDYQVKSDIISVPSGAETNWLDAQDVNEVYGALLGILGGSKTVTSGITASTTQSQGQGALTTAINEVSTVATDNDTVTLPTAVAGDVVVIINNDSAQKLQVFPASSDTIDGAAANASIVINPGGTVVFRAADATNWNTVGMTTVLNGTLNTFIEGAVQQINARSDQDTAAEIAAQFGMFGHDSAGADVEYGQVRTQIDTATAGSEDGSVQVRPIVNGSLTTRIESDKDGNVFTGNTKRSVTAGITASTTQSQGNGALTSDINEISTVANASDTVTLPTAIAGMEVVIINNGANILQIFPASSDNLGQGTNTATLLKPGGISIFEAYDATNWRLLAASLLSKSATIEDPMSNEDITLFYTTRAITIREMRAILIGSSTPSVTWTIRHNSDRNAAGAEVVTGGTVTTNTTTGESVTTFNDATIPAGSFVWFETTAQSGTVDEISTTLFYTED